MSGMIDAHDIIGWYNNGEFETIHSSIKKINATSLIEMIQNHVKSCHNQGSSSLLRGVFWGCEKDSLKFSVVLLAAYKECIQIVSKEESDSKVCSDIICALNHEACNLPPDGMEEICRVVLGKIQNAELGQGYCLKLVPKILELAQLQAQITQEKSSEIFSGTDYVHNVISEICSCPWQQQSIFHLADMFKDIQLSLKESHMVVSKFLEQLPKLNSQALPPFIYQLLTLASSCKQIELTLHGIIKHFNNLDQNVISSEDSIHDDLIDTEDISSNLRNDACLRSVEGTVLLYLSNNVRQNQALGKALLKLLKNAKDGMVSEEVTQFFLALSLAVAQDSRFHDDCINTLKLLVLKSFQEKHKIQQSQWLKEHTHELTGIKKVFQDVIRSCRYGWDHVISSMVDLCFSLMACYGPKQGPFGKSFEQEIRKMSTPQQHACDLGNNMLAMTFKLHEISRKEIVQQILSKIRISNNIPAYLYIDLLKAIVKSYPHMLLDSVNQLKAMLDDLPVMHEFNVKRLLTALLPLIRISASLRDGLVLVLRKSLSARQQSSRLSAVFGFLLILKNFRLTEMTSLSQLSSQSSQSIFSTASSQVQVDVQDSGSSVRSNEMLCLEILQALKRCLHQQASVRSLLYCGMLEVIGHNPKLGQFILNSMLKQIRLYYEETEDIIPPLKLSPSVLCINDTCTLQEPIHVLLESTFMCLKQAMNSEQGVDGEEDIVDQPTTEKFGEIINSITTRMCKAELDDFQLEKSSDYNSDSKTGQRNTIFLSLVLSIYQVLIDYNCSTSELTVENANQILQLHQSHKNVHELILSLKITRLSGKKLVEKQLSSVSAVNLSNVIHSLFCDDSVDMEAALNVLQKSESFMKYVINSLHDTLLYAKDHGSFPGVDCRTKSDAYGCVAKAARACLHKFMIEKNDPTRSPVTVACLECFHVAVEYINIWQKSKMDSFLAAICNEDLENTQGVDRLSKLIKRFQRIVMSFVATENLPLTATHKKILPELLAVLDTLFDLATLHSSKTTLQQCTEWWQKLCVEYKIDDSVSAKRLLYSHLRSAVLVSSHPEVCFRDICYDLRTELGSIEAVEDAEQSPTYQLIASDNAHHVLSTITSHIDGTVSDCEWLLQYLKGRLMSCTSNAGELEDDDEEVHESRRKAEGSICTRLCTVAVGLLELAHCSCRSATNVENILRIFVSFFTFLTNLTKYYLWLYGQGIGHVPSRFEKLTSFIGSDVMRPIYGFIIYAETAQTERLESARAKQDSKKKKKSDVPAKISATGKAKVLRETKGIARLVYAIEQHEHNLILLGRRAKIDFMKAHHLPTSRDFRIRSDVLRMSLAEQDAVMDKDGHATNEEAEDASGSDADDAEPNTKRPRVEESP